MTQPARRSSERRGAPRQNAAFTLWFSRTRDANASPATEPQRRPSTQPCGGWVTSVSRSGAAFLAMGCDVPDVGERIDLSRTIAARDAGVVSLPCELPRRARVVRVDEAPGLTHRVAITFEEVTASTVLVQRECALDSLSAAEPTRPRAIQSRFALQR